MDFVDEKSAGKIGRRKVVKKVINNVCSRPRPERTVMFNFLLEVYR